MEQKIQGKFIRTAKSPSMNMVKIIVNDQEQWADCTPNVKSFARKNFKEGQDIVLTASLTNKRYNISRIEAAGRTSPASVQSPVVYPPQGQGSAPLAPVQQQPAPSYEHYNSSDYQKPKTPQESERMTRLSVLSSVCAALAAAPGQIDVNTLWDVVEAGYARLLVKVKG